MAEKIIKYKNEKTFTDYENDDDNNIKLEALGKMQIRYSAELGIQHQIHTIKDIIKQTGVSENDPQYETFIKEQYLQKSIYHLMTGLEFLEAVDNLGFMDYDGTLCEIYIDGYISNLGLSHRGLSQGNFLMDYDAFKEICEDYDVLVNWANK